MASLGPADWRSIHFEFISMILQVLEAEAQVEAEAFGRVMGSRHTSHSLTVGRRWQRR